MDARLDDGLRPRIPHPIAGFGRNHEFIAVTREIRTQDTPKAVLGGPSWRTVVVRQIEMGNPQIERSKQHRASSFVAVDAAEVVP